MPKEVFGIIYAGDDNTNLRELINLRNTAALPVGGRYRVIDFLLSNMVNSNIRNIGVITRRNYQSLMDHIGSGKEWDLNRKQDGLFILPPYDTYENTFDHLGWVDALKGAGAYIRRAKQQYCLITGTNTIYNDTFEEMFKQHIQTNADITMMYNEEENSMAVPMGSSNNLYLDVNDEGRITDMQYRAGVSSCNKVGMNVLLVKKEQLQFMLENAHAHNQHNLISDVVMGDLAKLRVFGYKHEGYVARLESVAHYYKTNMDFLRPEVQSDLFYTGNNIFTKTKDEAPAKYGEYARVNNSLIGSGCVIDGTVENSILFRGVYVAKGAMIKNSIIMQDSQVYEDASIDKVILDKNVNIRPRSVLVGSTLYPVIIPKGGIA